MKRTATALLFILVAGLTFAGPQLRFAIDSNNPAETFPADPSAWNTSLVPGDEAMGGWHWEVLLDRFGFGMHYGIRIYETELADTPHYVDWNGDFFLSYHPFGGGAVIDPFLQIGWGNAGTAAVSTEDEFEAYDYEYRYEDWEDEDDDVIAAAMYTSIAAGVALDLNGLLLGVRVAHRPASLVAPIPEPGLERYDVSPFEVGIFGGVAIGSHGGRPKRDWHDWDWDWDWD